MTRWRSDEMYPKDVTSRYDQLSDEVEKAQNELREAFEPVWTAWCATQPEDSSRVTKLLEAQEIIYEGPPQTFESTGQRRIMVDMNWLKKYKESRVSLGLLLTEIGDSARGVSDSSEASGLKLSPSVYTSATEKYKQLAKAYGSMKDFWTKHNMLPKTRSQLFDQLSSWDEMCNWLDVAIEDLPLDVTIQEDWPEDTPNEIRNAFEELELETCNRFNSIIQAFEAIPLDAKVLLSPEYPDNYPKWSSELSGQRTVHGILIPTNVRSSYLGEAVMSKLTDAYAGAITALDPHWCCDEDRQHYVPDKSRIDHLIKLCKEPTRILDAMFTHKTRLTDAVFARDRWAAVRHHTERFTKLYEGYRDFLSDQGIFTQHADTQDEDARITLNITAR